MSDAMPIPTETEMRPIPLHRINTRFIRDYWIPALESNEYRQTKRTLRRVHPNGENADGFCCLGVACDVAIINGLMPTLRWIHLRDDGVINFEADDGYEPHSDVLPHRMAEYVGCDSVGSTNHPFGSLAHMNDQGHDFTTIKTVLEQILAGEWAFTEEVDVPIGDD